MNVLRKEKRLLSSDMTWAHERQRKRNLDYERVKQIVTVYLCTFVQTASCTSVSEFTPCEDDSADTVQHKWS
jgi:hypothetical protein